MLPLALTPALRRITSTSLATCCACLVLVGSAQSATQLDTTFGTRGIAKVPAPKSDDGTNTNLGAVDVARQADGKIVVLADVYYCYGPRPDFQFEGCDSESTTYLLARFTRTGRLDSSFGKGGIVRIVRPEFDPANPGGRDYPELIDAGGLAIDRSGRMLVAGVGSHVDYPAGCDSSDCSDVDEGVFIARFRPNGTLDESFAENGYQWWDDFRIVDEDGQRSRVQSYAEAVVNAVVADRAGGYTATGPTRCYPIGHPPDADPEFCAFTVGVKSGQKRGNVTKPGRSAKPYPFGIAGQHLVARPNGTTALLRAFSRTDSHPTPRNWLDVGAAFEDGDPPNIESRSEGFTGTELVATADNRLIVVGTRTSRDPISIFLARYTSGYRVDRSFGKEGIVRTRVVGQATGLARDIRGRLLVSVGATNVRLARYLSNGALDKTFGQSGTARFAGRFSDPVDLIVQPDGKAVELVGCEGDPGSSPCVALVRFKPNG